MSSSKQFQPYQWPNRYAEYGFCVALCMTQFLAEYLISGFALQLPLISEQQQSSKGDSQTSALWPASLLSLVMSAVLLICARLSDMFSGYWLFLFGAVWLSIWSFVPGFATSMVVLNCARAMQGLALACCKSIWMKDAPWLGDRAKIVATRGMAKAHHHHKVDCCTVAARKIAELGSFDHMALSIPPCDSIR